jgi:hypothetical protein
VSGTGGPFGGRLVEGAPWKTRSIRISASLRDKIRTDHEIDGVRRPRLSGAGGLPRCPFGSWGCQEAVFYLVGSGGQARRRLLPLPKRRESSRTMMEPMIEPSKPAGWKLVSDRV